MYNNSNVFYIKYVSLSLLLWLWLLYFSNVSEYFCVPKIAKIIILNHVSFSAEKQTKPRKQQQHQQHERRRNHDTNIMITMDIFKINPSNNPFYCCLSSQTIARRFVCETCHTEKMVLNVCQLSFFASNEFLCITS